MCVAFSAPTMRKPGSTTEGYIDSENGVNQEARKKGILFLLYWSAYSVLKTVHVLFIFNGTERVTLQKVELRDVFANLATVFEFIRKENGDACKKMDYFTVLPLRVWFVDN